MYGSGKNNTCYIRVPFTVDADTLADVNDLTLKVRYDDGFVAYLNGKEVARRNFTGTPAWNSHADCGVESNIQDADEDIDLRVPRRPQCRGQHPGHPRHERVHDQLGLSDHRGAGCRPDERAKPVRSRMIRRPQSLPRLTRQML